MTTLTVTEDASGKRGLKSVDVNDVLYLSFDSWTKKVLVHTRESRYYMPGTIKFWETCLEGSGHGFVMFDRGTLVNADKVTYVNDIFKVAYFEDNPSRKSVKCDIAHNRFDEIVSELWTINDNIQRV